MCNFGFAEDTHARENPNKFGFPLAYSYLCTRIETFIGYAYRKAAGSSSEMVR